MKNLKDTLSTICAILIAIGGVFAGLNVTVLHLPPWITAVGAIMVTIGSTIIGILTGKNPDGTTKSIAQVDTQNSQAK